MEAAAEGAVGLSEAGEGSPLSGAAASEDGDAVMGVGYGMDPGDMDGRVLRDCFGSSWRKCVRQRERDGVNKEGVTALLSHMERHERQAERKKGREKERGREVKERGIERKGERDRSERVSIQL